MNGKKTSNWLKHLASVRVKFPKLTVPQVAIKAKASYHKLK
jgi:hypothetical protein